MALKRMKILAQPIPFEKILYLFILIFNLIAIALINTFDTFVEYMLYTDVLVLALIKGEKAVVFLITIKYQKRT